MFKSNKAFRNGLSLGIISFLLGGPVAAGILFAAFEILNLLSRFGKSIITYAFILLLVIPFLFWKKGRLHFWGGYYFGLASCLLITYLVVRILAWALA